MACGLMKKEPVLYKFMPPGYDNTFPNVSGLEEKMQASFAVRGMEVVDGYFDPKSGEHPRNLAYFIISYNVQNDKLIRVLIAAKEKLSNGEDENFEFIYYDKIFVVPENQKNGIGNRMVSLAREVSDGNSILPSLLRTSDPEISEYYGELSDIVIKINGYFIHGFGFPEDPLFKNADDMFKLAANYIASKPATAVKKRF